MHDDECLDKEVYAQAGGALQERMFFLLKDIRCKINDMRWMENEKPEVVIQNL